MAEHNNLGKWGERIAYEYLLSNGYTILQNDTREGHYEIDLIATKGDRIIFVEVKTRSSDVIDPLSAITPTKIKRMCVAANSFVRQYNLPYEVQFDLISITGSPDTSHRLVHIPDAFRAPFGGYK